MKIRPLHFFIFWLVLNLVQAAFTELTSDEAYYWFYSRSLEWGYYDHPPFIALMVRIGYALFPNELGVRLVNVILNALSVLLLFRLVPRGEPRRDLLIYGMVLSLPLLNYLAFIIFPDGPLLFFFVLFLIGYKRFLEKEDLPAVLLIGCSTALMLYSKYHGVLVVGFTLLSNLRLLRSPRFWLSMVLALVLFLPHLGWQYAHQFPTFQFHLQGRTTSFTTRYLLEYLSQQLPAIGPGLIFVPFVYRTRDRFERALQLICIGTFGFFLFTALKAFVHFHWTSIALFPLLLLASRFYEAEQRKSLFQFLVLPLAFAVLVLRLYLMFRIFPVNHLNVDYYHGRRLWAEDIQGVAGDRPVLFGDNFRESSLYAFYSGHMGIALQSGERRRSQYELWNQEDSLQGREVVLVQDYPFAGSKELRTRMDKTVHYFIAPGFSSYYDIPVEAAFPPAVKSGDSVTVPITVSNPRNTALRFARAGFPQAPALFYVIRKDGREVHRGVLDVFPEDAVIPPGGQREFKASFQLPSLEEGAHTVSFGIRYEPLLDSYNSKAQAFRVGR
ncbi:ArnT family glycosyltransferase [Archangium lansingense]|uniref:Glycosyltransferase family 39 protein n=1 Tax=Archangium lansingense TaxID=2995310 RepID=A0ABT4A8S1_9BACT|nr:glycosyltransferase family 39 protein [Archangium lansinium]MCY1077364.1 glycosyltransferase family 39 protein [Archangium lansinium]